LLHDIVNINTQKTLIIFMLGSLVSGDLFFWLLTRCGWAHVFIYLLKPCWQCSRLVTPPAYPLIYTTVIFVSNCVEKCIKYLIIGSIEFQPTEKLNVHPWKSDEMWYLDSFERALNATSPVTVPKTAVPMCDWKFPTFSSLFPCGVGIQCTVVQLYISHPLNSKTHSVNWKWISSFCQTWFPFFF